MSIAEKIIPTETLVTGCGFGGSGAQLAFNGEDYQVIEKADGPGGIWRKNRYPGVRCDVPPQMYSYRKDMDTTAKPQPDQKSTLRHLEEFVARNGLDPKRLRFNTRLYSLHYDDRTGKWTARTKNVGPNGDDVSEGPTYVARFVILATGQLDEPFIPAIPGQERFQGRALHTARWDEELDLTGMKVAVIGTGPSATQFIPAVAPDVERLTVFQRTPNWVMPSFIRNEEYGNLTKKLLDYPIANKAYRLVGQGMADFVLGSPVSRGSATNLLIERSLRQLRRQVPDRELQEKLKPTIPLACKRPIISNDYYSAFMLSNVKLITAGIREITEEGIVTEDGVLHKVEVIVYATGFQTTNFYPGIDIRGRGGLSLKEEVWQKTGPEAYLGTAFVGMPNLFALHGPGAFTGWGSNVIIKEYQLHLIVNAIKLARSWTKVSIEVLPETMERYRRKRAKFIRHSILLECDSWYRDKAGRVINPHHGSMFSFWLETRRDPRKDFGQVALTA